MHGTTIAVDLAKSVFEVAISNHPGTCGNGSGCRASGSPLLAEQPTATVLMLQNPRTLQVLSCRGSARAIESCVASLEIDGGKRLGQ
jgi:hypothetical protein